MTTATTETGPPAKAPERAGPPDVRDVLITDIALDLPNHRHAKHDMTKRVEQLADSMRSHGLQQPILVCERPGTRKGEAQPYMLVYGHGRLAAANQLQWETIAAEVRPPLPAEDVFVLRAIENLHRQDLNIMEQVKAVQQVCEKTGDVEKAAGQLGQTVGWVQDRLYLAQRITDDVAELAFADLLLAGHLRELAKLGDPVDQLRAAMRVFITGGVWEMDQATEKSLKQRSLRQLEQVSKGDFQLIRCSVDTLRQYVDSLNRSLKRVPWELHLPIVQGKSIDLPACEGCEHNTATDETLFGKDNVDDKGLGRCMNRQCFEAKTKAAEKAKNQAVAKLVKRKMTAAADVDATKPDYLKRAGVQREVKKQLDPNGGKERTVGGKPASEYRANGGAGSGDPEQANRQRFNQAVQKWAGEAVQQIVPRLNGNSALKAAYVVFCDSNFANDLRISLNAWSKEHFHSNIKQFEAPVPAKQLEVIRQVFSGTPDAVATFANDYITVEENGWFEEGWPLGDCIPAVVQAVAQALSIELPAPPKWDDYKPAPPKPKTSKKKPTKKKKNTATQKNVLKKKAGKAK